MLSESRRNLDCFLDGKRLIVFGTLSAYMTASEACCATVLLIREGLLYAEATVVVVVLLVAVGFWHKAQSHLICLSCSTAPK